MPFGRIFDTDTRSHNVYRLLDMAEQNPQMFSKDALGRRRERDSPNALEWLPGYLRRAHEPTARDFHQLRTHADKWREVYKRNYAPIRHKHFAHRERIDTSALFAKTNIRDLQLLLRFLRQLEEALWEMFTNGRKPVLRTQRYSVQRMTARPSRRGFGSSIQERIIGEAEKFLMGAAGARTPKDARGTRST